ncbi:hypothetical protein F4861DRAFT_508234 [Xylaria intraflava]|nr:hypothetical protein F4861DRAFT_508234 [Xylaria intraflava]
MGSKEEKTPGDNELEAEGPDRDSSTIRSPYKPFLWPRRSVQTKDIDEPPERISRYRAFLRHVSRYRFIYGISCIVLLAIFLLLLFLKIIPAIAQLIADQTPLPIYNGEIEAISSDELTISLKTSLTVPSGLSIRLSPLQLHLYNKNTSQQTPFLEIPIAGQQIQGKTNISITDETVRVANLPELNKWLRTLFLQTTTQLSVKGTTNAYLGVLKNPITLDKTIEIPGLRGLAGASITSATLLLPPAADGANIAGRLVLPNASGLSLALGNNSLDVWAGDVLVAGVELTDVRLSPGNNTLPFRGRVFADAILRDFAAVLASQADALAGGKIALFASGNGSSVSGARVAYVDDLLRSVRVLVEVPVVGVLAGLADSFLVGNASLSGLAGFLGGGLAGNGSGVGNGSDFLADFLDSFRGNLAADPALTGVLGRFHLSRERAGVLGDVALELGRHFGTGGYLDGRNGFEAGDGGGGILARGTMGANKWS